MAWIMETPNGKQSSDDFTLDDLISLERDTETPWSGLNPLREVKIAKAFLKVAYRNAGLPESDVDVLTLGSIKNMFDFEPDLPVPGSEGSDDDAPLDLKGNGSSRGASAGSTGGRPKRAKNASATSSS